MKKNDKNNNKSLNDLLHIMYNKEANNSNNLSRLMGLVASNNKFERGSAAGSFKTPQPVLEYLSYDLEPYVRERVANNPYTSKKTLKRLSKDEDPTVRYLARENLARREKLRKEFD